VARGVNDLNDRFSQHVLIDRTWYHQGIGGKLVMAKVDAENDNGAVETIKTRSSLSWILNFYHREAAIVDQFANPPTPKPQHQDQETAAFAFHER
jgi:hypothetical protein